jgi:peptidoglycan-associated lipoprotein
MTMIKKVAKFATILLVGAMLTLGASGCKKKPKDIVSTGKEGSSLVGGKNGGKSGANSGAPDASSIDGSGMNSRNGNNDLGTPQNPTDLTSTGAPIPELQNVHFALDSDELEEAAVATLTKNNDYLAGNQTLGVVLRGHCDDTGTSEYNTALGERRASNVREWLIKKGISADRMQTISFGEDMPLSEATDEAARAQNRRVEFFVYTLEGHGQVQ